MPEGSVRAARLRRALLVPALALLLPACSDYKKLSAGGSIPEVVVHDMLGQDRAPSYYYQLVRGSHQECDFCYRCGTDPFLVDKNVDALQRLGRAEFGRLEGEAEVVELFTEVLLEDGSSLARSSAANSLTQIGVKLPDYPGPRVEDRGDKFLAYAQQLDRLYIGTTNASGGPGAAPSPGSKAERIRLVEAIGNLDIVNPVVTRDSLKFFYGRPYLIDERDPAIREAIDTALVKRMRALILDALEAAVSDEAPDVRVDAIKGLKTMGDRSSVESVAHRLAIEASWLVRMEIAEYFGRVGTREGVIALVALLEDSNASVRHKAHQALVRVAGQDYGIRQGNWKFWARKVDPEIDFGDEEDVDAAGEDPSLPPLGP